MAQIKKIIGDIAQCATDAIVISQNIVFMPDSFLSIHITDLAGSKLTKHYQTLEPLEVAKPIATPGYNLPAKFIFHIVPPIFKNGLGIEADLLSECYINSLRLADELNLKSIAFPALATGFYKYPKEFAIPIGELAIKKYFKENPLSKIQTVYLIKYESK